MTPSSSPYLTKSDFKTARECPTKLFYKKSRYASRLDEDPYLAFLADGGYMVETMARALFPEGRELQGWENPEEAARMTQEAIEGGDGTFFEATILQPPRLARIDILGRRGRVLELIEVKSTSLDPGENPGAPFRGSRGGIASAWRPYLEDVTYQAILLERTFPQFEVRPFLCVIDKSKRATDGTTFDKFRMIPPPADQPRWRAEFEYLGDPAVLAKDHLLAIVDVSGEVAELREEVERIAMELAGSLGGGRVVKIPPHLGYHCKKCEYRLAPDKAKQLSGFSECWGPLARVEPHVLDLYRADQLGGRSRDVPGEMAAAGQAGFAAIPEDAIQGAVAIRQRIQIESTATGREWVAPELGKLLGGHSYPLHFIDFEGSRLALPYHVGMRPYEQVGFQWSCHTIRKPGGSIEHAEWLNAEDAFPNFDFARSLMKRVGSEGTVYIWSTYELTMLRDVRRQMAETGHDDRGLLSWIDAFVSESGFRVVDLCALARQHYLHPDMKGSVSIKAVFPAVWRANPDVRRLSCFRGLSHPTDPYKALPALPVGEDEDVVREGTGAIRAYQDMMFGLAREDKSMRQAYRQLLLQYCGLDTAAMVAVWWHWTQPRRRGFFSRIRGSLQ